VNPGEPHKPLPGDKAPSSLGFLLSQVGIYASQRFGEAIGEIGIHPPLFRVLNVVDVAEGQSQQAIGAAIQAPPSRMVAIVDELEERGLIERRPHPGDRRVRALYLTAKGRKVLDKGREIAANHEQRLTQGMSKRDSEQLIGLLRKLADSQGLQSGVHPGLSNPKGHASQ
jgi:DNA-binding MarR family transcriptional regulator